MGVPGYFKWLITRCADISVRSARIDCLYLDLNGILHPSCHGDSSSSQEPDEDAMLDKFCLALDEIIATVGPQKLIYFAFDGPAPTAKMVQQRSRRFCSAHNLVIEKKIHSLISSEWQKNGIEAPAPTKPWDSNKITPGTPFMEKVKKKIESYIADRLTNPSYAVKDLIMLLSDSSDPGEGEHKLIQFIKRQKMSPDYDPSTTHCLVGTDADLIQLALSIHDPNIFIYRETMMLSIRNIREYFRHCFSPVLLEPSVPDHLKDFERLLDDMLLCFCFVGNDFLPHLPQMKITANAVGRCLAVYVSVLPKIGEFLTTAGEINLKPLDAFVRSLSTVLAKVDEPAKDVCQWYERIERGYLRDLEAQEYYGSSLDSAFYSALKRRCELYAWKKTAKLYVVDPVCVSTPGWQHRYYQEHWKDMTVEESIATVSREYVKGLQWVMHYYHRECPDWGWAYPYGHGPTLDNILPGQLTPEDITFPVLGGPLLPMQQLLAVLPRAGAEALLPRSLVRAMDRDLDHFFPKRFRSDCSNCPPRWMEFAILPEINFSELSQKSLPLIQRLPLEDRNRNVNKGVRLFVNQQHSIAQLCSSEFDTLKPETNVISGTVKDRKSSAQVKRLPTEVVRFSYSIGPVVIRPRYFEEPPQKPDEEVITRRNSLSPLSEDPRLDWKGMEPFKFHFWDVEIDTNGTLTRPEAENRRGGRRSYPQGPRRSFPDNNREESDPKRRKSSTIEM